MLKALQHRFNTLRTIIVFFCLAFIPAYIVYHGLSYFEEKENMLLQEATTAMLKDHVQGLSRRLDSRQFLLDSFHRIYRASASADEFNRLLLEFFSSEKLRHDYAVWEKDEVLYSSNFIELINDPEQKLWHQLPRLFADFATDEAVRQIAYKDLRAIFGSNFFMDTNLIGKKTIYPTVYIFDGKKDAPFYLIGRNENFAALLRIEAEKLVTEEIVRAYFSRRQTVGLHYVAFKENEPVWGNLTESGFAAQIYSEFSQQGDKEFLMVANRKIAVVKTALAENLFVVSEPLISNSSFVKQRAAVFLLLPLGILLFIFSACRFYRLANMSIVSQTLLFVFIAAGIPVAVLVGNGIEFYQNRESLLINQKAKEMSNYLQAIDRRSEAYLGHLSNIIAMNSKGLLAIFNSDDPDINSADYFDRLLNSTSYNDFVLMSSGADKIISKSGWVMFDGDKPVERHQNIDDHAKDNISFMWPLGRVYLELLNDKTDVVHVSHDLALMIETFFLKPYSLVIADFMSLDDKIQKVGFGGNLLYSYFKASDLNEDNLYDTFVVGSFVDQMINRGYANRIFDSIQRNPFGMKVFMSFANEVWPMRKPLEQQPDELRLLEVISDQYDSSARVISYMGEEWVFSGFECRFLDGLTIWGLYPVQKIRETITSESLHLLLTLALSILLVISLMLIFNMNLIRPVRQLSSAAAALEQRDFNFRITDTSADEFGEMGLIFNRAIEDFEELHIASMVQARLFPLQGAKIPGISLFAKTVPMAELGGDYHDYFEIDDCKLALMLGDVAGHGVGASLIMAMAKAGVICSGDRHDDPAAVLKGLHALVRASRSKRQRKIMTFQFASFNRKTGHGVYSNAGGCNPIIVSPITSLSRELVAVGAPLGAFKKADFSNVDFQLMPGEALVFYTDGVVEAVDESGREIGYDNFFKIVSESYDSDANSYYDNIFRRYSQWTKNGPAQDDVSILVMVYQPLVLNLKKH